MASRRVAHRHCGPSQHGQTALATDIALHAAHAKKRVLIFSLEMTKEEVSDRITASSLGVPTWKIEKGDITDDQVRQIGVVVDGFADCPLFIDDDPDTSLSNLRARRYATSWSTASIYSLSTTCS